MVLTRKRAAEPPAPTSLAAVSMQDSSLQSNLKLLASSASSDAAISKAPSTVPAAENTPVCNSRTFSVQPPSGSVCTLDVPTVITSTSAVSSHLSASTSISGVSVVMATETVLPQVGNGHASQTDMSVCTQSAAVTGEASAVVTSGCSPSSQKRMKQITTAHNTDQASSDDGKQPKVVQYKIVYKPIQPAGASTGQKYEVLSVDNTKLSNLLNLSSPGTVPATSAAYALCAAPSQDGGPLRPVLVPVSRATPSVIAPGANLLNSSTAVQTLRPQASLPSPMSTIPTTSAVVAPSTPVTSSPCPVSLLARNGDAVLRMDHEDHTHSSSTSLLTTQPSVQLPDVSTTDPPVTSSQAVLSKAASTSKGSISSSPPAAVWRAASAEVVISTSESSVSAGGAATEGEAAISWDRQSTLKLIELYKEHQNYLKDHHYKKKSVWELIARKLRQSRKDSPPFCWNHVENKWKNMTKKYRDCVDLNHRNGTTHRCSFHDEIAAIYTYCPDEDQKKAAEGLRALKSGSGANRGQKLSSLNSGTSSGMVGSVSTTTSHSMVITKQEKPVEEEETPCGCEDTSGTEPLLVKKKKYAHVQSQQHLMSTSAAASRPLLSQSQPAVRLMTSSTSSTDKETSSNIDIVALLNQLRSDRAQQEKARMDRLEQMHREKMTLFSKFLDILKQSKQT